MQEQINFSDVIANITKIIDIAVKSEANIDKVLQYLVKFGYLKSDAESTIEDILHAIVELHNAAGATNPNGTITAQTLNIMSLPRCGCRDIQHLESEAVSLPKWGKHELTYSVSGHGTGISQTAWDASIRQALSNHEAVCNIKFTQIHGDADINISMGQGAQDQFDGPSGVLAWCELPPTANFLGNLQSKADQDETWLTLGQTGRGILAVNVFCHELGHGLGLSHTNVVNSLMNPFYNVAIDKPQTHDIKELVNRYGTPISSPTPVPVPVVPTSNEIIIRIKNGILSIDNYNIVPK